MFKCYVFDVEFPTFFSVYVLVITLVFIVVLVLAGSHVSKKHLEKVARHTTHRITTRTYYYNLDYSQPNP